MSVRLPVLFAVLAAVSTPPASAAVDPVRAQAVFQEAARLCGRDGGELWHHSLCGPILLVDWTDNTAVANQADPQGALKPPGRCSSARCRRTSSSPTRPSSGRASTGRS